MKLLVIDGNSIMNRAFYGIRVLTNKKGMPTNALTGFLNIFLKLMKEEAPDPHRSGVRPACADVPAQDVCGLQGHPPRNAQTSCVRRCR